MKSPILRFASLLAALAVSLSALAEVSEPTVNIRFKAESEELTRYEVKAYKWAADGLTQTKDIVVSPAKFEIRDGNTQVVKAVLKVGQKEVEGSYKLLFSAVYGGNASVSMPVFVPSANKDAKPEMELVKRGDKLVIRNNGLVTERITQVIGDNGIKPVLIYILPKSQAVIDAAGLVSIQGDAGSYRL